MGKIKIVLIFVFSVFVFSQDDESNRFSIHSKSMIFRAIGESNTEFEFKKTDSTGIDSMVGRIDLYRDSETKKQSIAFGFDGEKTTFGRNINLGGEWNIPVFLYKNTNENNIGGEEISYQAAAVSLGFVAKNTNDNFPFRFSAGPAFEGGLRQVERDTIFGGGGYFSITGGDTLGSRIAESPFLFGGEIFGRYIKSEQKNRNTAAKSNLTYEKNGIFSTDTLAIFINNTIGLGEVNSQFGYINGFPNREIPNKYSNNLSITFRATQIGNAFFEPSLEFTVSDNRYRYLNTDKFYGSLKKNSISALGFVNKEYGNWYYKTGLRISGTKEENSYFSSGTSNDTLEKLKNANVFNPQYYFLAKYVSPKEITHLSAKFVVERNRRMFPFFYKDASGIIMSNDGDFDNISQQIKLQSDFYLTNWYNLYLSAERLRHQIYFLKSKMSASSRTEERFAFELGNVFSKDSTIILSLTGLAVAAPQKYYFANFDEILLPFHNRLFGLSSDLTLGWTNGWANTLGFSVTKFDRGVIHGENYYGIEEKKRETVSSISLSKSTRIFILASGFETKIMQTHNFDYIKNDYLSRGNSYLLTPFASGNFALKNNFSLDFSAKRNIAKGHRPSNDFWDISLNLLAAF